jgi:hypothetical protein
VKNQMDTVLAFVEPPRSPESPVGHFTLGRLLGEPGWRAAVVRGAALPKLKIVDGRFSGPALRTAAIAPWVWEFACPKFRQVAIGPEVVCELASRPAASHRTRNSPRAFPLYRGQQIPAQYFGHGVFLPVFPQRRHKPAWHKRHTGQIGHLVLGRRQNNGQTVSSLAGLRRQYDTGYEDRSHADGLGCRKQHIGGGQGLQGTCI